MSRLPHRPGTLLGLLQRVAPLAAGTLVVALDGGDTTETPVAEARAPHQVVRVPSHLLERATPGAPCSAWYRDAHGLHRCERAATHVARVSYPTATQPIALPRCPTCLARLREQATGGAAGTLLEEQPIAPRRQVA